MKKILIIIFAILLNVKAFAAPDAGKLLKQQQELDKQKQLPKKIPKNLIKEGSQKQEQKKDTPKIYVKKFVFKGNRAFKDQVLSQEIEEFYKKDLSFFEIQNVALKIQKFYNKKGYFLATAIIPKQEVKDGIITILISEGKLSSTNPIILKSKQLRLSKEIPNLYLVNSLKKGLTQQGLERGLLNLNDNPGVAGTINLEPGDEPGSTRIILDVVEGPLISGSFATDNYGSRYTGELRAVTSVQLNDPGKFGDQISFTNIQTPKENYNLNQVNYNFPIGRSGFRTTLSYTKLNYKIGKELETNPQSMGSAELFTSNFKYPALRTVNQSFFLEAGVDHKKLYNETTGVKTSDKRLDNINIGFSLQNTDNFITTGFSQLSFTKTYGDLDLSRIASSLTSDQGAGGAKTDGKFQKLNVELFRIQRVAEKLNLHVVANFQHTNKNLDSSEKMSLGGASGVRAYPSGEASGDEGRRLSIDAKYNLISGSKLGDVNLSIFYDYGKIKQYKNTHDISMTTPNHYSLEGWGVSADLISSGIYFVKIGWADAIGGNPGKTSAGKNNDGRGDSSRYWLMASVQF